MNMLLRSLLFAAIIHAFSTASFAQPFVVVSDDAKFYDSIGGSKMIAEVPRNTRLYGLERKERWVKAVDPKSKMVAWISWEDHLSVHRDPDGDKKRRELVKREAVLLTYGIDSPVTTQQYDDTLEWAKEIRNICGDVHPVTRAAWLSAAVVTKRANARSMTELLYQKALGVSLNLYGNKAEQTADIYLDLAYHYVDQGEMAKAAGNAKSAILIYGPIFGFGHPKAAECWVPLANAMYLTGEYEDAIKYYSNAERGYSSGLGKFNLNTVQIRGQIAACYECLGDIEKAIEYYSENLSRIESDEFKTAENNQTSAAATSIRTSLTLLTLKLDTSNKSEITELITRYAKAKSKYPSVRAYVESLEKKVVLRLLREGRLENSRPAFEIFDTDLKELRVKMRQDLWNVSPEKQNDYLSIKGGLQFFEAISFAVDHQENAEYRKGSFEWLINAKGLVREAQAVRASAKTEFEERTEFAELAFVQLDDVLRVLPENAVYVDIIRYLDHDFDKPERDPVEKYAAWIADKNGKTSIVDLGLLREIDQQVIELKAALLETALKAKTDEISAFAAIKPILAKATAKIWEPIRSKFGDATTVILSPDQTLWLLPWSAMLNPDGKYAVEKYQIQLELSGRDLIRKATSGQTTDPVVFADPDFGPMLENKNSNSGQRSGVRIGSFPQLKFSAKEASLIKRWIARFDTSPIVYSGRNAMEAKFKKLRSPSILVMSTHGYYLDENGRISLAGIEQRGKSNLNNAGKLELQKTPLLKCGLLLTDGNKHTSIANFENDGVLTGPEIAQADLKFTKLAVLSACQTGVGTLEPTAGVIGMRSAFHAAGVRCIVTTLWPIPDEETLGITNSFFKKLSDSKQVRSSLQLAQKEQIERRRRLNGAAHPYFWAAFNVSGEAKF